MVDLSKFTSSKKILNVTTRGANFNAMFVLFLHLFLRLLSSLLSFSFTYLIFNFMLSKLLEVKIKKFKFN